MTASRPNRIAIVRKSKGLSQQQLADLVGAHWVTVSKLERGRMQLTQEWLIKFGDALSVPPHILLASKVEDYIISLNGYIREGSVVEIGTRADSVVLPSEYYEEQDSQWYCFFENLAWPTYKAGDLIRFVYFGDEPEEFLVGRTCLVKTDKYEMGLIGIIEREAEYEKFYLRPFNGWIVKGAEIKAIYIAAEVRFNIDGGLPDVVSQNGLKER